MKRFYCLLILLLFCGLAAGCGRQERQPGTLRVAVSKDATTLDPAKAYDTNSIPYVRVLYRGLVDYDDNANIVNEIAKTRTVSPDGLTYRFVLRDDVHFHSGRRVVADDFRYALERVLDPATASDGMALFAMIDGAEEYTKAKEKHNTEREKLRNSTSSALISIVQPVRGIEVKSDDEIIFHLKRADATFLNYLALPFAYAVNREHVEQLKKSGKALSEHPDGNGPFIFEEWVHDAHLRFRRNPHYFRRDLPRSDRLEVQMQIPAALQTMLFEQGRIDTLNLSDVPAPEFIRMTKDPQWKPFTLHAPMMDIRYLCMNTELKPFDNVLVRRAMNHAINTERIASFQAGRAQAAPGILPPGMPAYNPKIFHYAYDPDKARELFKQAGYEKGFPQRITLWCASDTAWIAMAAQSIQQDLKKVGIDIDLKMVTYAELKAKGGQRGGLALSIMGWYQDFTDPSNFLDVLLNGKAITPEASNNRAFYSNPKVNALLDRALVETNRAKRLQMYADAETLIMKDAPWVCLVHTENYAAHQPWVSGFSLHPMWSQRYEYIGTNGGNVGATKAAQQTNGVMPHVG